MNDDKAILVVGAGDATGGAIARRFAREGSALVAQTERAVARGVFRAPTCFVGDEMFFGQDRSEFVREALNASSRLRQLLPPLPHQPLHLLRHHPPRR